jgi:ABC-2 type transport system permease protein
MSPLARFGEISLAYMLQVLLPLILVLIAYPSFAAERESGTLRQVMASGVTGGQLFVGKFVGLSASALLLMLPIVGFSLLALGWSSGAMWLSHAVLLCTLYLWYVGLMLGLALLVSAVAATARTALLILLIIWAFGNFVVPRIAADMGRLASPTPSADALLRAIENDLAAGIDGETPAAKIEKRRRQLHALYKVSSDAELPINIQGVIFGIQDEISDAVYDRHFSALEAAIDRQIDIFEAASILSPRMAVMLVSQELSGTSIGHQRQFANGAEAFRRELMGTLNRDITLNSRSGDNAYRSSADLWREAGEYRFVPEQLGASIARCGAPLTVLVLWSLLIGGLGWASARRLGTIG